MKLSPNLIEDLMLDLIDETPKAEGVVPLFKESYRNASIVPGRLSLLGGRSFFALIGRRRSSRS